MEQRIFEFVKECTLNGHTYQIGTQIELFRGIVSMNGGMLMESYQAMFRNLIENEIRKPNYLREIRQVTHEF